LHNQKNHNYVWDKKVKKHSSSDIYVVAVGVILNIFSNHLPVVIQKKNRPQNKSIIMEMEKIYSILENSMELKIIYCHVLMMFILIMCLMSKIFEIN
jgi:hypothetical protein